MNTVSDLNNFVATRCAIADITLADFGRKEIAIAETEMPGLIANTGVPLAAIAAAA